MVLFLYDFCPVGQPFERSSARLLGNYESVLADAARAAFGADAGGELRAGQPRRRDDAVVIPVAWHRHGAGAGDAPFDGLDGDLQLAEDEDGLSHLSLSATCVPVGKRDEARTRRRAEERIRRLLGLVAARLAPVEERAS